LFLQIKKAPIIPASFILLESPELGYRLIGFELCCYGLFNVPVDDLNYAVFALQPNFASVSIRQNSSQF